MEFRGEQRLMISRQINNARPEIVFPLLCPVREKDWLDGWNYKMIFSNSGLIEKNCVFATLKQNCEDAIWYVTVHDKVNYRVELIRVTPGIDVVKINIDLYSNRNETTTAEIAYQYTGLNCTVNSWMQDKLENEFEENMMWWERSINHYLQSGEKLKR